MMGYTDVEGISIVLLNLNNPIGAPVITGSQELNIETVAGDARDLNHFEDNSFDMVFSNSVIEHVGGPEDWKKMANEIRRVGRSYFVQTPNRYFPIEPHFLFPFFHFLPLDLQIFLLRHLPLGYAPKSRNWKNAKQRISSIQLLSRRQFTALFPGATLHRERFLGLTKSFVLTFSNCNAAPAVDDPGPGST